MGKGCEHEITKLLNRLMVGHVLVERRDLMLQTMQQGSKDALDLLLDYLKHALQYSRW